MVEAQGAALMLRLGDLVLFVALVAAVLLVAGLTLWWLLESVTAALS